MTDFDFDLDSILDDADESGLQTLNEEDYPELETIPYIRFIQKSTTLSGVTPLPRTVAIGRENAEGNWEGHIFRSGMLKFWVVRPLVEVDYVGRKGASYRGGRTMWKWNEQGLRVTNSGPACKSLDGKTPLAQFVGREYTLPPNHFAAGHVGRIGFIPAESVETNEKWWEALPPEEICKNCIFAQWPPSGKRGRPLCAKSHSYVIYIPPQAALVPTYSDDPTKAYVEDMWPGGLAILQGSSPSVQLALEGREPGQSGGAEDGGPLPSLMSFITSVGNVEHEVEIDDLRPAHTKYIIAVTPKKGEPYDVAQETLDLAKIDKTAKSVTLRVPLYKYARSGLPEQVGSLGATGLHYLTMDLVPNVFQQNPTVPRFAIHSDPVDMEHYMQYYQARKEFEEEGMYDTLMLTGNVEKVGESLGLLTSGAEDAPQLASGSSESFDDISDM